jgi:hypothetical protein
MALPERATGGPLTGMPDLDLTKRLTRVYYNGTVLDGVFGA